MDFGGLIRRRRKEMKLTLADVCERSGLSKPYLSNIETSRYKHPPTDKILEGLEKVLKFPPGELVNLANVIRMPLDMRQRRDQLETETARMRGILQEVLKVTKGKPLGKVDLNQLSVALKTGKPLKEVACGAAVPIINRTNTPYPIGFNDLENLSVAADDYVRCPEVIDPKAFGIRVHGDSMLPEYHHGDVIIVAPQKTARNGSDCFIRLADGGRTIFRRMYRDQPDRIRLQPLNTDYPAEFYSPKEVTGIWPAVFRIHSIT